MNLKDETLKHIGNKSIKCIYIFYCYFRIDHDSDVEQFILPVNHTNEQANDFIASLDFNYDNGYGSQRYDGTIWYKDGSWSERTEYDGSEWWAYRTCPEIPKELKGEHHAI
jgi:hypothetical protein